MCKKKIDDCHCCNKRTVTVILTTFQWFEIKQSVRQGRELSGFLYCALINDLRNCLRNVDNKFGVHTVKSGNPALAGDIACISLSPVG